MTADQWLDECPSCDPGDCLRCHGTGEQPDPDPHDERWYRCTACAGTGRARS